VVCKKMLAMVFRFAIGGVIVLGIWKPLRDVAFWFAQGPDPRYDFGGNYEMWYRPPWGSSSGGIVYWPLKEEPWEHIISEPLIEFALTGPWIVGRTAKSWFAINKESHDVHKLDSKVKLEAVTGLDLSGVNMETDPTPYLIVKPAALAAKAKSNRLCWILLFLLPLALGFGPVIIRRRARTPPARAPTTSSAEESRKSV